MLIGPEAHFNNQEGIKLDISQYICIGLLILMSILLASYILFIRCRYFRSRKCASCGQTVPISGRERIEGFWRRIWHEGCWKAMRGEVSGQVEKVRRAGRGGAAMAEGEEGRVIDKGGAEGVSLLQPKKLVGPRSPSGLSTPPSRQTIPKYTIHTPTVSSPLNTSVPTLAYSGTIQPELAPSTSNAQPILKPDPTETSSFAPRTLPTTTQPMPPLLPIPQPQLKPPPRQASLYIRQVQTYTPTTTVMIPPRSTSMYANSYSTLSQYDVSRNATGGGGVLRIVQEADVPMMGMYKVSQSVDSRHSGTGRESQNLRVQVEALEKDESRCGVAL